MRPNGLIDPEVEVRPVTTQVDDVLSEIHDRVADQERVLITTLTKRMSEDLTEYLDEHGVRVRYLHSDIDTVERVEIIQDLRKGIFDVLVGINLLREGLDIPEVSLVAIFDADKEGFLRSDRSLIQTIGRAARNLNGKAILYADKITGSMQRAMDETRRRREKQLEYNQQHGITPRSVKKSIGNIMEGAQSRYDQQRYQQLHEIADEGMEYGTITPQLAVKKIHHLEQKMYDYARNLEFEDAARVRDEIQKLKSVAFEAPSTKAG